MPQKEANFGELILDGVRKTVNKFREHPSIFFSEMDLHSYMYYSLYTTRFEAKTADGVITTCVHKEYPTNFRYSKETMEDFALSKKGVRGHFDFAVLNPKFIQTSKLAVIANKEIADVAVRIKDSAMFRSELLAAIEVKYVVNNSWNFIDEVKKDTKKLLIGQKYQDFEAFNLVFCNHDYHYLDDLAETVENSESTVKSVLVISRYAGEKKETPKPITNGWMVQF